MAFLAVRSGAGLSRLDRSRQLRYPDTVLDRSRTIIRSEAGQGQERLMNEMPMTTAEDLAREQIEAALRDLNYCAQCGGWMRVDVRGAELWVECESLRCKRGLRLAISAGFHDRRRIELPEGVLAAA
jgi:hypothetical protein